MNPLGRHVVMDAELEVMPEPRALLEICEAAIAASGMSVECSVRKDFRPHGMTAVWVLAKSHFTVHTYPEHRYISVDCYTCGDEGDPDAAVEELLKRLEVARVHRAALKRGVHF